MSSFKFIFVTQKFNKKICKDEDIKILNNSFYGPISYKKNNSLCFNKFICSSLHEFFLLFSHNLFSVTSFTSLLREQRDEIINPNNKKK